MPHIDCANKYILSCCQHENNVFLKATIGGILLLEMMDAHHKECLELLESGCNTFVFTILSVLFFHNPLWRKRTQKMLLKPH